MSIESSWWKKVWIDAPSEEAALTTCEELRVDGYFEDYNEKGGTEIEILREITDPSALSEDADNFIDGELIVLEEED